MNVHNLNVKLFVDSADLAEMLPLATLPYIKGFTTNPTLMRQAGVKEYRQFVGWVLANITDRPVSFEVFADEPAAMIRQAKQLAALGPNVYVKIPVTNTQGVLMTDVVRHLSQDGVKVNVTAIFTLEQVRAMLPALQGGASSILSVFAGRIADTGHNPLVLIQEALLLLTNRRSVELLWASTREVFNIIQANAAGCHIITVTPGLLGKLDKLDYALSAYSLDTVKQFYADAQKANYTLE